MIDKAFGMREVAERMTQEPMVNIAGAMIMSAETDEEKMYAVNLFGQTLVGLMAYAMSELMLSAEDFATLTATIDELTAMEQAGEDN
jgi:uncharacterized membrane protein affecting hemolysin expression